MQLAENMHGTDDNGSRTVDVLFWMRMPYQLPHSHGPYVDRATRAQTRSPLISP